MLLFPNEPAVLPVFDEYEKKIALTALTFEHTIWPTNNEWAMLHAHIKGTAHPDEVLNRKMVEHITTALMLYAGLLLFPKGHFEDLKVRVSLFAVEDVLELVKDIMRRNGHRRVDLSREIARAQEIITRDAYLPIL